MISQWWSHSDVVTFRSRPPRKKEGRRSLSLWPEDVHKIKHSRSFSTSSSSFSPHRFPRKLCLRGSSRAFCKWCAICFGWPRASQLQCLHFTLLSKSVLPVLVKIQDIFTFQEIVGRFHEIVLCWFWWHATSKQWVRMKPLIRVSNKCKNEKWTIDRTVVQKRIGQFWTNVHDRPMPHFGGWSIAPFQKSAFSLKSSLENYQKLPIPSY